VGLKLKGVFEKRVIPHFANFSNEQKIVGINVLSSDGRGDNAFFYGSGRLKLVIRHLLHRFYDEDSYGQTMLQNLN
jgi:hypothetical protein